VKMAQGDAGGGHGHVLMMWLRMSVGCVLLCAPPPPVLVMPAV
jgi:hypothetical protein